MSSRIVNISFSPPQIFPRTPRSPRDRWRLNRQLKRLEVRLEASQGRSINRAWLGWMEQYMAIQDALEAGIDNSPT